MDELAFIHRLQRRLEDRSRPATRDWWERYLKGVIGFRGVRMADIRTAVHAWRREDGPADLSSRARFDLVLQLIRQPLAEDKLVGGLYLQEALIPSGEVDCSPLREFASLFDRGHIYDWNTCDWFCVRVLSQLVDREGESCARALGEWAKAENLWRRRAAGVAFVKHAARGGEFFPGFTDFLLRICHLTVQSPQRFAQTGTGWVVRSVSSGDRAAATAWIENHLPALSREGVRYCVEKLPDQERLRLLDLHLRATKPQGAVVSGQGAP